MQLWKKVMAMHLVLPSVLGGAGVGKGGSAFVYRNHALGLERPDRVIVVLLPNDQSAVPDFADGRGSLGLALAGCHVGRAELVLRQDAVPLDDELRRIDAGVLPLRLPFLEERDRPRLVEGASRVGPEQVIVQGGLELGQIPGLPGLGEHGNGGDDLVAGGITGQGRWSNRRGDKGRRQSEEAHGVDRALPMPSAFFASGGAV